MLRLSCAILVLCLIYQASSERNKIPLGIMTTRGGEEVVEKCLKEIDLSEDEFHESLKKEEEPMPEKMLCLFKCMSEKNGVLHEDGTMVIDERTEEDFAKLVGKDKIGSLLSCIGNVGKIFTCEDMGKAVDCVHIHKSN